MGNPLATFGLMMRGADAGRTSDRVDRAGNVDISNGLRRGVALDQSNELGAMGIDTARQTKGTTDAVREAQKAATQQGRTWSGSLLAGAEAAASRGETQLAAQLKQQYQDLEQIGIKELINSVMSNSTPGERPDLLKIVQQYEKTRDAAAVSLDDVGNITVTSATQGPVKFNAGKMAEIIGMVAQPKIHNVPAGGVGVVTQPGRAPYTVEAPKTYPPSRTTLKSYGEEGHPTGETLVDETGKQIATTSGGAGGGAGGPGGTNVRKDLQVLKEITQGVTELGEEYGKTDMSNPLNPKVTLTPKGQQVAMVAEQIRLANQLLAPRTIIDMAVKGKPMWKTEDGKRTGVVLYNGQEFPMSTAVSRSPQPERPSPAPAAPKAAADKPGVAQKPAQKPAAKPAESPTAKAARERRTAAQAETEAEIERFNKTLTTPGVDRERAAKKKEEIARDTSEKERGNVIRKEVAERLRRFSKDDQIWFSDHAKDLSPRERKALHDRRARGGYEHGGKVSQAQHYGLG